jgi:predicted neuraminidase
MPHRTLLLSLAMTLFACGLFGSLTPITQAADKPGVLVHEFLYEKAPFPSCHASTIAQTPKGLVTAFFGGSDEGNDDVGIWVCRRDGSTWSAPVEVANGVESTDKRYPCWNPVLYQAPDGPLLLFYKVGPNPIEWWGMLKRSEDHGQTWSSPERLPEGMLGPIKNKPVLVKGDLLCPSSTEQQGRDWRVHMERTADLGRTWEKTESVADPKTFRVIQPTILVHPEDKLQILCRSGKGKIAQSWSYDGGKTWSPLTASVLPNPDSGIDAVNLQDGRMLLVYNHTRRGRSPINVALTRDGQTWEAALELETEPGEFSYPAVICTPGGHAHITYTWKRKKIKYAEIDPAKLETRAMVDGVWPK